MSVKDVREYYDKISEDYHELVLTLKELEEEYNNNLVSPEALENLKKQIEPIKTNFRTISYIIYLLNQPTKKKKQNRYRNQNKALLENSRTLDEVRKENRNIIKDIKKADT